jgi:hypothetical protein
MKKENKIEKKKKKKFALSMNNILVQNSKILSVVSHFYGVMPSTSW